MIKLCWRTPPINKQVNSGFFTAKKKKITFPSVHNSRFLIGSGESISQANKNPELLLLLRFLQLSLRRLDQIQPLAG